MDPDWSNLKTEASDWPGLTRGESDKVVACFCPNGMKLFLRNVNSNIQTFRRPKNWACFCLELSLLITLNCAHLVKTTKYLEPGESN